MPRILVHAFPAKNAHDSMTPAFSERLLQLQRARKSVLCVGLDPDPQRLPQHLVNDRDPAEAVLSFNLQIIEATAPFACAFKLNFAFYERLGADGWRVLSATAEAARKQHLVIADAKRGDIGNSARFYAEAVFEQLRCDACTVAPYMGSDAVEPFLSYDGRAAFVLVRTSNPGGAALQELTVEGRPMYMSVAQKAAAWAEGRRGEIGFVIGATDARPVEQVRTVHPEVPLLIPGVGAQGGDVDALMKAASIGSGPVMVNSSRGIIFASSGLDFADAAARAAEKTRHALQSASV